MPTKAGIRVYQMTVHQVRHRKPLPFDTEGIAVALPEFVTSFINQNAPSQEVVSEKIGRDRHWYFQSHTNTEGNTKGLVHYGISGFESELINSQTNKSEFRRKTNHVEIVPLFYEFWFPPGFNHGLAAFQSFAARSCVELVSGKMREDFGKKNSGFSLHFQKLLPIGTGGLYNAAPVKGLRLIRRNASSDVVDRYLNTHVCQEVDFQIVIAARRKGVLGKLADLTSSIKAANGGVVKHDGITFDEAVAEIEFGGRKRRIGIFGSNSEAGVIDLTNIKRAPDGHPAFAEISKESSSLLADFQADIGKSG